MIYLDPEEGIEVAHSASWGLERVTDKGKKIGDGGKDVYIYVLDTGIRWGHTDFGGRASAATDSTQGWFPWSKLKVCKGEPDCGADKQGHGTHCAGTAGGKTYGIADKATVFSSKVLSDSGSGQL